MQQIIGDMFSAGSETVKTTLQWATLFAVREPQVQAKVQAELDRVVGRRRLPSLDDLPNLPYTEAVILEVMRRATAVPLGTTHCTSRYVLIRRETLLKAFLNERNFVVQNHTTQWPHCAQRNSSDSTNPRRPHGSGLVEGSGGVQSGEIPQR